MRTQREKFSKFLLSFTPFRYILSECKNMRILLNKPKDINVYLYALRTVKNEKKKAANLLFEEIEHDVKDKEKFVVE